MKKRFQRNLWIGLLVLAALSPLGIIIPRWLGAGGAWGEWSIEKLWSAPIADYGRGGILWYAVSAAIGLGVCAAIAYAIGRAVRRRGGNGR